MFKKILIGAALVLACSPFSLAQGVRASSQITSSIITPGPLSTVPTSVVAICAHPANAVPCTNKATTYTDITLGTPCSTSTQVVLDGTTSCVNATDNRGNWGIWIAAGTYDYTITVSTGQSFGPFWFTAGGSGGGGGSGTVGPCGVANALAEFGTTTSVICSSVTDDGVNPTRAPNGLNSASGPLSDEWLVDTGGVQANKLACRSASNAAKVVICPAGATLSIIGVAQSTVAAGGTVIIEWGAKASVCNTNNTAVNDWLIPSVATPGCVDDTGSTTPPTAKTFAWPAESAVAGGSIPGVLITNASLDTLIAQAGGGLPSCLQFSLISETGAGTGASYGCINAPTGPNNAVYGIFSKPSGVATNWTTNQFGVLPRALSSSDTIAVADIAPGLVECILTLCTVTVPDIGATGFANGPVFKAVNGNGTLTFNHTSASLFRVANGNTSTLTASFSLNAGDLANFSKDADGTDWLVTISPPTISSTGTTPNVNPQGGATYTVLNSDNTWVDKFTAGAVTVTLPQANTLATAAFIQIPINNASLGTCSTCTTANFAQSAGHTLVVTFDYASATPFLVNSVTDTAGDIFTRVTGDQLLINSSTQNSSMWQAQGIASAGSNAVNVNVSGSVSSTLVNVLEYAPTPASFDHAGSAIANAGGLAQVTIPLTYANEIAVGHYFGNFGLSNCPPGWLFRGGGTTSRVCDRSISTGASSTFTTNTGAGVNAAIFQSSWGIPGQTQFMAGWYVYIENATSPCGAVTVTPTTSHINTSQQSALTSFIVPCGMTAGFMSDGTDYEMFSLAGSNAQTLTAAYTNGTTGFTSTALAFPLQANQTKSGSCHLTYQGTATTAAPILQFTGPAAPTTITANVTETLTSGSSPTFYSASTTGSTFAIGLGATAIVSTATDMPMQLDFGITNGGTAGTVTLQAKSNGAGTVTFEKGSTCVVY